MILCTDRVEISGVEERANGFVVVSARVARAGNVQAYAGSEVGKPSMAKVRVYRPDSQVFDKAAVQTLAHKPVTLEHPSDFVTADNWHRTAVGWIGDEVLRDGEFLRVPMTIAAKRAIDAVRGGQRELSVGYQCDLQWGEGKTPAGEAYDAMQTNILVDHVAIVERGRAGPECRIGDWRNPGSDREPAPTVKGNTTMDKLKTLVVDGLPVEMTDMAATIVQRQLDSLAQQITAAVTKANTAETAAVAAKTASDAKDGQIAALTKQLADAAMTPAKLDALVKDRTAVIDKARKILGDKAVTDGKSEAEIRRAVVVAKLGDETAKGMSDDAIAGAFLSFTADAKPSGDRLAHVLSSGPAADTRAAAHVDYTKRIGDAWRAPARV